MNTQHLSRVLTDTVQELSSSESLHGLMHQHRDGNPLPSGKALAEIIDLARAILFPGFYGKSTVNHQTLHYHIGVNVERLHRLLSEQVWAGLCFACSEEEETFEQRNEKRCKAEQIALSVIAKLPEIRRVLATDVEAAYNSDPAAKSREEVVACYPVVKALVNYRLAHELYELEVPLIPRMMTEQAHSETGIDIHPRARIGEYFTIDHGTGVVIGATCIIGNHVKLYQGVTLGARNFPMNADGNPIKGIPRHPILEDHVVVYANATILGRITIGEGCVVGANVWVTQDMRPNTKKFKRDKQENIDLEYNDGTGI